MPDPRFFEDLGPVSLAELAALTGAELSAPGAGSVQVARVAILARASADSITYFSDRKLAAELAETRAAACFVTDRDIGLVPQGCVALVTRQPTAAYAMSGQRLHRPRLHAGAAAVSRDARVEEGAIISPGVVIGQGAQIGRGSVVGPNTVIGPGVAIGRDCVIGANVSIHCALLGDRVKILAGAVIGEAGFGATAGPTGVIDIPQLGRVILQDGVTVGANTCIDRGAYEDTVLGENTKIDNLVQIAHNVRVGRNCVMAAFTGISGSVTIGDGSAFGGRAGVADHVIIGEGAQIGAGAGVFRDVAPKAVMGGYPAMPMRQWLREVAWLTKAAAVRRREEPDQ
ncbi:MAG: UDP-3-O-(3-hydroxymyristoyl)glucosamine N-acyltransferase [Phenylobacterium sp.]|uniref:UDP-3-O-(3-hydroxymyristoyl)glucosamine N-acyltransferase n=1 Tax=Phenylobacterium sp. TaxID=1871053 RepID=UPI0027208DA3|nr:UDP-3-O-(3-hydroxymyristoyl)glucosamine N-acyltransferase [Phenylobacterium sp.]MDO8911759.1 UDP-3-O-(3-hydroxymyristoyl)glucosamine N-acyltransferase [Phenylobacterium sp.]MDP3099920.1 UDP-3-O-(3-hydroxymyristoyl)glucosamine N-acyltransferase [Phenylobacterium sp.]MDP3868233.1 UDP-3-O-(3-hydroxymyristoyl)glucosamine N-acyltransferase [Phenylobacterium sp.]